MVIEARNGNQGAARLNRQRAEDEATPGVSSPSGSAPRRIEPLSDLVITTMPTPFAGERNETRLVADILPALHDDQRSPTVGDRGAEPIRTAILRGEHLPRV